MDYRRRVERLKLVAILSVIAWLLLIWMQLYQLIELNNFIHLTLVPAAVCIYLIAYISLR
jgi:hypothetical protein